MRFNAEIDFSSEAHQLQVLAESIDIRCIKKNRQIDVTVLRRRARCAGTEKVQSPYVDPVFPMVLISLCRLFIFPH